MSFLQRHFHTMLLLLSAAGLAACQEAARTPATLDVDPSIPSTVSGVQDPASVDLGVADLSIDLIAQTATLTPHRNASAIGDDFSELGLTPAFNKTFGDHFQVVGIRTPSPGLVEVDVAITHPFSAATRPDLGIFNVKCTVVTDSTPMTLDGIHIATDVLTNADGYSDAWRLTHPDNVPPFGPADVQPYVILHEDPTSAPFDFQNPAGWNVLFPGQSSTNTLALNIGTAATLQARLFLTADYGQSAVRATRLTPVYQLPRFAGNAPWKIAVTELANDLNEGEEDSTASYQVDIWDWKHGQSLGSDVIGATLSVPDITDSPIDLTLTGSGSDPTPLTTSVNISNEEKADQGTYFGLIAVEDEAQGIGLEADLITPISFNGYTTYFAFPVSVRRHDAHPTAVISRCIGGNLGAGIVETFDGSASYTDDDPITDWEWDFDYDGSNFTVDATGVAIAHAFAAPGTPTVALRVWVEDEEEDVETASLLINPEPLWRPPMRATNNAFLELIGDFSELANGLVTDADGTVHLVYYDYGSVAPTFTHTIMYQQFDPCVATWSLPTQIHGLDRQSWTPLSLVLDAGGQLHLAGAYDGIEIGMTTRDVAGSWSPMTPITTDIGPGNWLAGQLALNGAGDLGLAAVRALPNASAGSDNDGIPEPASSVYFTQYAAGTWSAMTPIGTMDHKLNHSQGSVPSLTLEGTSGSDFVAVWHTLKSPFVGTGSVAPEQDVAWSRTLSGVWTPQALLYSTLNIHDRPLLKRAPNGTLFLGMETNTEIRLGTYDGTTWSPSLTRIHTVNAAGVFQLAFDTVTGEGMLVTSSQASTGQSVRAKRFLQTDTPAAIAASPDLVVVPASPGRHLFPQVTSLGGGRWLSLWASETYGGWADGMELESACFQ